MGPDPFMLCQKLESKQQQLWRFFQLPFKTREPNIGIHVFLQIPQGNALSPTLCTMNMNDFELPQGGIDFVAQHCVADRIFMNTFQD